MINDKDVKKLVSAFKKVFATKKDLEVLPTAKMMNDSFNNIESRMATKDQVQKIDDRLKVVEDKLGNLDGIPAKVRKLEDALAIDD